MTTGRDDPWWYDGDSAYSAGFEDGAAAAFGIMGMFEAIKKREDERDMWDFIAEMEEDARRQDHGE